MAFELAKYEAVRRIKGGLVMSVGFSLLVALYVSMFPSMTSSVDLESYTDAFPEPLRRAFGVETLGTIEGFMAAELYAFGWVLLLGLYFAYAGAGLVAGDVEHGRTDLLLSLPTRRWEYVIQKFAALVVPMVIVNTIVPVVVYVSTQLIDESMAIWKVASVHALSFPYLLATAAIGLLASVLARRSATAQRGAMAVVFGFFLVDSVVTDTDWSWMGAAAPMRHYDPTAILVHGEIGLSGAGVLAVFAVGLVTASCTWFEYRDLA